ncbi:peptidyl-prolyl cis-trans isomerase [Campylobacter insulaenigrae]|nr:peptidylprolyl isomerase [Campylobacter insulaenigrae]MCR6570895.1 peptidyl-prolyl cis-trans isomerase [Campylobacter insulaenigrae]MCR6572446.1 peptidyl-prolyl cis-trans isomerase [Campylobacter insulaenigrae]MCR6574108.1 peptidyl-prolyl cis-trans isomerase [Campylobacter insulaenigrae]MCR6575137.1 peptidyl-prolyl cis-trans isomerase [Campylobacter insulaenigrae]MCR6577160.1 peptidyl-prolyl cis-trans isomerase [Campylobacter insulaenigrae]
MKKFLISCSFAANILYAQTIGGVAMIVENEPITLYDINQAMKQLKTNDKQKAIAFLVDDKIQQNEAKNFGIVISDFDLKNKLDQIAKGNNTDINGLQKNMEKKGLNFELFKEQVRKDMQRERLYHSIMQNAKVNINDEVLKKFYEDNLDKFSTFSNVDLVVYNSTNPELLQQLLQNPMYKNEQIKSKAISLNASNIDPRLLALLNNTKAGDFTPVLNGENAYIIYFVKEKYGKNPIDFDLIKEQIGNAYTINQKELALKNHLDKIRSNAHIEEIR